MNVLIYAGASAPSPSVAILRRMLSRAWDVKLVDAQLLAQQPWQQTTALVVFPDLAPAEFDGLTDAARQTFLPWLARGGRYLGIGAGAQFAGAGRLALVDLAWKSLPSGSDPARSAEPPSERLVSFYEPPNRPCPSLHLALAPTERLYVAENPARATDAVKLWASYPDPDDPHHHQTVAVLAGYGNGSVALLGFGLSQRATSVLWELLALTGLSGFDRCSEQPQRPSPVFLLSCLPTETVRLHHQAILQQCPGQPPVLQDTQDSFAVSTDEDHDHQPSPASLQLVLSSNTSLPEPSTCTFDFRRYFLPIKQAASTIGTMVLYAETMASTQTLLEKNSNLAGLLPNGTVSITKYQTNGRGRGNNRWITSDGSIQFSVLLKLQHMGSSMVFVQYLFGLAVVEWINKFYQSKLMVKLKWPNDLYGSPTGGKMISDFSKMGGILVNCSFGGIDGAQCRLVIGFGFNNCSAPQPSTTCLSDLIQGALGEVKDGDVASPEETIAGILVCFDQMWTQFQIQGFQPFMSLYLSHWLHSGQVIKYEKTGQSLKIIGIDPTYGLLRTQLIDGDDDVLSSSSQIIDLQPDSNSFDIFSGLIKAKT